MAQQPPETSGMGRPVSLSLVIPCYNEEKTLAACVERCLALREHGIRLELLIVDDCSTDNSLAVARGLGERHAEVMVLHHEKNRGKGARCAPVSLKPKANMSAFRMRIWNMSRWTI